MVRVLVTGAAGRLGRRVVARLVNAHEMVGLDRVERPAELPGAVAYVQADLRDELKVHGAAAGVDAVVHLGAIPGRAAYLPQSELYAINVQGTYHALEGASKGGARVVVLASSLCAVGLPDRLDDHGLAYLPIDEAHPCRPRHTYDLSKRVNEITAESFTRWTGVATICLRFPFLVDVRRSDGFAERVRDDPPRLVLADYLDIEDAVTAIEAGISRPDLGHQELFLHAETSGTRTPTAVHIERFRPRVEWRGEPPGPTTPLIDAAKAKRMLNLPPTLTWQSAFGDRDASNERSPRV